MRGIVALLRENSSLGWSQLARETGVEVSTLRSAMRREFNAAKPMDLLGVLGDSVPSDNRPKVKQTRNTMEISAPLVYTLEELLRACKVDLKVWEVRDYLVNQWQFGTGEGKIYPLYQVKAWLVRKNFDPILPIIRPIQMPNNFKPSPVKAPTTSVKRCLVVPDPHMGFSKRLHTDELTPFHDRRVLDIALQLVEMYSIHKIVFLGDVFDLSDWSTKYLPRPEFYWTTQPALLEYAWWLGQFRKAAPDAEIVQFEGNHEKRLTELMLTHMKAAYELRAVDEMELPPSLSIPRLLSLHKLNVEYVDGYPDNKQWLNRNVVLKHGDVARGGIGETSKAVVSKTSYTSIFGHIHRQEMISRRFATFEGDVVNTAFCPGCACHVDGRVPGSTSEEQWQQGLAVVDYTKEQANLIPVSVNNGMAIFNGELIKARDRDKDAEKVIRGALKDV